MNQSEIPQRHVVRSLARINSWPLRQPELLAVPAEEIPHMLDYWHIVTKRGWAVLSCFALFMATVTIATLKQNPVYRAKVLIEVNPEPPNVLNFKEVLQINSNDVDSYRETQYKVLQSRTLAERVVGDLQLYLQPEFYRKRAAFGLVESDPEKIPLPSDVGPPDPSQQAYRNSVANFLDAVDVTPVHRSTLVEVSFESRDPQLAALVANRLASDYINQNLEVKWEEALKASEWLSGRLVDLKGKLEKSEDNLQTYAKANSILFVEEKQELATTRLKQLEEQYTKAQTERFQKEASYNLVQADKVQDLPGFLSNKLIQDLSVRLAELDRDYAQMTAVVKPDYPRAVQLRKQVEAIQSSLEREKVALAQNIVDEFRSAQANERFLAQALDAQKREVNDIAEKSIAYNILKREVDTNKQLYEGLLQRLKEAQVSAGLKSSNLRVVDSAEVPKWPVRPRVALNLALGALLGLGLGVAFAFFQEYLDNTLKNADEVEQRLRLPSLGVLPRFSLNGTGNTAERLPQELVQPAAKAAAPGLQTHRAIVEAFRSLRTSILLSASPVPKTLLITSALPVEGKTTLTVNLGATLASLGSRVVIVDCDMRRPACHRLTGVPNVPGFVQCLTGHSELGAAILAVPGVPNLNVVPCGPIPPNPAEVLSSPLAGEMLRRLRDEFEYVLLDSPPLLSVADSRIIATFTDAVVLVVRAYATPYDAVRRACGLLYNAGARVLGVALNDLDLRKGGYGYGYGSYRYGYGYGYGYGEGGDSEVDLGSEESR